MIKPIIKAVLILLCFISISCANVEDAEPFVNNFYKTMQDGDYDELMELMDESMIEAQGYENLKQFIVQKQALGSLESYTQEGETRVMESDGKALVRFMYTVHYSDKILYEYVVLVKRDTNYFINNYGYFDTKEKREEFREYNETF